ncbi:MAG: terminase [Dehalococcoidia bacterium]
MTDDRLKPPPRAPAGLKASGRRLWRSVVGPWELDEHEAQLLLEACRTADQLDELFAVVNEHGATLPDGRVRPALTESRQLRLVLARLVASLRLPEGDQDDLTGRPQRRGAARRPYQSTER